MLKEEQRKVLKLLMKCLYKVIKLLNWRALSLIEGSSNNLPSFYFLRGAGGTPLHVMQPAKIKVIITTNTVQAIFTSEANHKI